jgi:hypothetical protein
MCLKRKAGTPFVRNGTFFAVQIKSRPSNRVAAAHCYNEPHGRGITMKKSELLNALQNEIQRHDLSTFMSAEHKIVPDRLLDLSKTFWDGRTVQAPPERRRAAAAVGSAFR